jgi:hypothetical protein
MKKSGSRAADRQAIDGGRVVTVREGGWSKVADQPPLPDETRFPKKKGKKTPKKERCEANPNGHTHEWMKDEEEIPVYEFGSEPFVFDEWSYRRREPIGYKSRLFKLCVHCGVTLVKGKGSRRWGGKWRPVDKARNYFTQYRWRGRKVIH